MNPQPLLLCWYIYKVMDSRKENYYNYILDDLVRDSKITYSSYNNRLDVIVLPFMGGERGIAQRLNSFKKLQSSTITWQFVEYVIKKYGAQDNANDNDVYPLWNLYLKRMSEKIKNG